MIKSEQKGKDRAETNTKVLIHNKSIQCVLCVLSLKGSLPRDFLLQM
jgi:hypothetical protein